MRLIVISDNHGNWDVVTKTLAQQKHDLAIHLGDSCEPELVVKKHFDYYVGGNNDFDYSIEEQTFECEGLRFFITHGHLLFWGWNYTKALVKAAKKRRADVVLFGHIHIPVHQVDNDVTLFCPGSIAQPRSSDGPTFLLIDVKDQKIVEYQFLHPSD